MSEQDLKAIAATDKAFKIAGEAVEDWYRNMWSVTGKARGDLHLRQRL